MSTLDSGKILLIHPLGYRSEAAGKDISRLANITPPVGLLSIAAYLAGRGLDVSLVDCFARPDSDRRIATFLRENRPAFIGFSCTTSSFLDAVRIATDARRKLPGVRTVFGGPHVSALKEKVLEDFPAVDFAVVGEGEETLHELIASRAENPGPVQGLVYRDGNGEVIFSGHRTTMLELDTLPFPAYEKLEGFPQLYQLPIFNYPRTPNTCWTSSRGCPYACSYCDRSVFRRSFRYHSAQYMYEHLQHLRERFGIRHVTFYDDQFTFNRERTQQFTELMVERPLGMTFNCAARAEHIDLDLLRQMKTAGCWMISLGIETGAPELLARHRQNADLDLLAEKIRLIKQAGIRTKGLFMLGLPGETEETVRRSMRYAFSLPIDDINVAKFTPFPGSPLYQRIHELGTFEEDWGKMDCMNFQFVTNGMTKEKLDELFLAFYRTHFMRPKVLWDYTSMAWRSPDSWRRFFTNMLDFLRFARSNKRYGGG